MYPIFYFISFILICHYFLFNITIYYYYIQCHILVIMCYAYISIYICDYIRKLYVLLTLFQSIYVFLHLLIFYIISILCSIIFIMTLIVDLVHLLILHHEIVCNMINIQYWTQSTIMIHKLYNIYLTIYQLFQNVFSFWFINISFWYFISFWYYLN